MYRVMRPKTWHSLLITTQINLSWTETWNKHMFPISLLIRFFVSVHLHQLRLRDYFLESQNKAPIGPDDILNIFPVVKYIHMPTVDASTVHKTARTTIQKGESNKVTLCSCRYLCTFLQNRKTKTIGFYFMRLWLFSRAAWSGPWTAQRGSVPVQQGFWWSAPWVLSLLQPAGKSGLSAGQDSWGSVSRCT